jgi:hypothetical protein
MLEDLCFYYNQHLLQSKYQCRHAKYKSIITKVDCVHFYIRGCVLLGTGMGLRAEIAVYGSRSTRHGGDHDGASRGAWTSESVYLMDARIITVLPDMHHCVASWQNGSTKSTAADTAVCRFLSIIIHTTGMVFGLR